MRKSEKWVEERKFEITQLLNRSYARSIYKEKYSNEEHRRRVLYRFALRNQHILFCKSIVKNKKRPTDKQLNVLEKIKYGKVHYTTVGYKILMKVLKEDKNAAKN